MRPVYSVFVVLLIMDLWVGGVHLKKWRLVELHRKLCSRLHSPFNITDAGAVADTVGAKTLRFQCVGKRAIGRGTLGDDDMVSGDGAALATLIVVADLFIAIALLDSNIARIFYQADTQLFKFCQ